MCTKQCDREIQNVVEAPRGYLTLPGEAGEDAMKIDPKSFGRGVRCTLEFGVVVFIYQERNWSIVDFSMDLLISNVHQSSL